MLSYWWVDIKLQASFIYKYIHTDMNEWVKCYAWEFPHKPSVFTAPDGHLPYIVQLHIMSIQPANKAAEHLISSLWLVSEKKTEAVNAYLIKNRERERDLLCMLHLIALNIYTEQYTFRGLQIWTTREHVAIFIYFFFNINLYWCNLLIHGVIAW